MGLYRSTATSGTHRTQPCNGYTNLAEAFERERGPNLLDAQSTGAYLCLSKHRLTYRRDSPERQLACTKVGNTMVHPVLEQLHAALADRYRIDRVLGRGRMATVFLAEDLRLGRRVALKVLDPQLAALVGPDRFLREIRTTARLTHPNILPLHEFDGTDPDGPATWVGVFVRL